MSSNKPQFIQKVYLHFFELIKFLIFLLQNLHNLSLILIDTVSIKIIITIDNKYSDLYLNQKIILGTWLNIKYLHNQY